MIARFGGAVAISALITFGLFFIMQLLVATGRLALDEDAKSLRFDITMEEEEMDVRRNNRSKPQKQEVRKPPPPMKTSALLKDANSGPPVEFDANFGGEFEFGFSNAALDRGAYPKFRVQQQWPRRAQERGISGWVIVGFTITKTGGVRDPYVIESSSSMFERYALKAVSQYKYEVARVNGQPVESPNQTIRLVWEIVE